MKRQNAQKSLQTPKIKPTTQEGVNYMELLPPELLKIIILFSMNSVERIAPWKCIQELFKHLKLLCIQFYVHFPTEYDISLFTGLPEIHLLALTGNSSRIIDLKLDHNHRPDHCIFADDKFGFKPSYYADQVNQHKVKYILDSHKYTSDKSKCDEEEGIKTDNELPERIAEKAGISINGKLRLFLKQVRDEYAITEYRCYKDVSLFKEALLMYLSNGGNLNHSVVGSRSKLICYFAHNDLLDHLRIIIDVAKTHNIDVLNVKGGMNDIYVLHDVISEAPFRIIEELLKNNVDLTVGNFMGFKPIHLAMHQERTDIIELLINYKADINARDNDNQTPLHNAHLKGPREQCFDLLIKERPEINAIDNNGNTPGHVFIINLANLNPQGGHSRSYDSVFKCLKKLIECGADVNIRNNEGNTLLHLACKFGLPDVIEELLTRNPLILKNNKGSTPHHLASTCSKSDCLAILTRNKLIHLDTCDNVGNTPLHLASKFGKTECIQHLIWHQADVNAKNKEGKTPLHLATDRGHNNAILKLINLGASLVDVSDKNGVTPLHILAIGNSDTQISHELTKRKNLKIDMVDENGETALHYAAFHNNIRFARILMKLDPHLIDMLTYCTDSKLKTDIKHGQCTALHFATHEGNHDMVKHLKFAGARTDLRNQEGKTVIDIAREMHTKKYFGQK